MTDPMLMPHHQCNAIIKHAVQGKDDILELETNAFGVDVDKPDVRFALHWSFPDSVESCGQAAGREGAACGRGL
jgi:superfamily II DNA helicase RecQ